LAPLSLSAYYYYDHALGIGSNSPHSHALSLALTSSPGFSPAGSPVVAVTPAVFPAGPPSRPTHILSFSPPGSSSDSPHGINLCVDLSKFYLQQVPVSVSSSPSQSTRTHPMVLRPCPPKDAKFSVVIASWVTSLPQQEPLSFKDANRCLV
jgi:hypothetical protein